MSIPARVHFCWIGRRLSWAYAFALMSAAERGGCPEVILHHTDALEDCDAVAALRRDTRILFSYIDPGPYLRGIGDCLGVGDGLLTLYAGLGTPVAKADVLRAAILYDRGGIYLDLDTVTVASLMPLTSGQDFVGSERIVWPRAVRRSRSLAIWARHLGLDLVRKAMRKMPGGWMMFRHVEHFYAVSVNNAVMGAAPGSVFLAAYLQAMIALPVDRQQRHFGLGPHLLQDVVQGLPGGYLAVKAPETFYPLPPEISEHWFRIVRRPRLDRVISAETYVAHWYASVRTAKLISEISPSYIEKNRERQMYSALVWVNIGKLIRAEG